MAYIGYTIWTKEPHKTFYVAQLPGDGGKDWGYTDKREQAIPLSVYWRRRFEADQARCNRIGSFVPL
jgi:hypothetical protein